MTYTLVVILCFVMSFVYWHDKRPGWCAFAATLGIVLVLYSDCLYLAEC